MKTNVSRNRTQTLARAGVAGTAAYLLGYLVTYLWLSPRVESQLSGINFVANVLGGEPITVWKGVGWYFYNGHFVSTLVPTFGGTSSRDLIAASSDGTITLLYLLPPALLLLAGFVVVRTTGSASDSITDAGWAGASIALPYLVLAVAGVVAFRHDAPIGSGTIAPDPVTGVLLAGIVYPVVFGAVGGLLAHAITTRTTDGRSPETHA